MKLATPSTSEADDLSLTTSEPGDALGWDSDPFDSDSKATLRLLQAFFTQYTSTYYRIVPQEAFMRWVYECRDKCQNELMVLYSQLALASAWARDDSAFARLCVNRAKHATDLKFGQFSLALVQSRLYLALYHQAKGSDDLSWDSGGAALRALSKQRLNTEDGCAMHGRDQSRRHLFGLSYEQSRECARRTFWSCFVLDVSLPCLLAFCAFRAERVGIVFDDHG